MVLGWRKKKNPKNVVKPDIEIVIPNHFRCPISLDLMKDPVILSTGVTYDRESIERWFEDGNYKCPVTNQVVRNFDQIPNHTIRMMIQDWCVQNQQFGIERIPTPRIPITSMEVLKLLELVKDSARRGDQYGCLEWVQKMERWGGESERNKRCIVDNGAASVFAAAFDAFSVGLAEENVSALEEILSALNWMFPLTSEAQRFLGSKDSIHCMVWFLKHQDVSRKQKSILVLREVLSYGDQRHLDDLAAMDGVSELLVELINKRTCPTPILIKASLHIVQLMVSSASPSSEKTKLSFVRLGIISSLLEILVDSDKTICEGALGVFDPLCSCEEGREKAYANALTVPVLVKKILRVSELATESSVSAIWKLVKNGEEVDERVIVEALQVGAFQKLLLILQIGGGDESHETKEKITKLLKLLNPYRAGLECIESLDFKNLKRSF